MAALDFPDNPSTGTTYDKWTWNGTMWVFTNGIGAGYTFVQEFTPTPTKVGDTWFDTSTTASGGSSWVAVEEGAAGSEKVWVQTSPGAGNPAAIDRLPKGRLAYAEITTSSNINSPASILPLTVTWTAVPSRIYRTTGRMTVSSPVINTFALVFIVDNAKGKGISDHGQSLDVGNAGQTYHPVVIESGLTGSQSRVLNAQSVIGGNGTLGIYATADSRCFIMVEDIGAV